MTLIDTTLDRERVDPERPTETYETLLTRVGKKSPKIPADLLVRLVLRAVPEPEWPVRLEAMDALLRRLEGIKRDELRIGARPAEGHALGAYSTRGRKSGLRPYNTILTGVAPIEGRCNCPDFLKNSLGACKHVLLALEHVYSRPRLLRQALKEKESLRAPAPIGLHWDPIRPLTGPGDWLERVTWHPSPSAGGAKTKTTSRSPRALAWFRKGDGDAFVLKKAFRDDPARRLSLSEDLLRALPTDRTSLREDPALRALLTGERERLRRIVKRKLRPAELNEAIKGLKRPLY